MFKKISTSLVFLSLVYALSAQVDLQQSLVAYYPFSNNFLDLSNFSNSPVENSGVEFVTGINGRENEAVYFDGTQDSKGYGSYVLIPNAPQLNFNNRKTFAISLWLKIPPVQNCTESAGNDILSKWNNNSNQPYSYSIRMKNQLDAANNGTLSVAVFDTYKYGCAQGGGGIQGVTPINDDTWHHLLFTREADGYLRLYIDCALEGEIYDGSICNLVNNDPVSLGVRYLGNKQRRPFTGSMDELRFYERQLNSDEIDALCGVVAPVDYSNYQLSPNSTRSGARLYLKAENGEVNPSTMHIYLLSGCYLTSVEQGEVINLPAGDYLVRSSDSKNQQITKKLVITK
jgi:hypothetical protein